MRRRWSARRELVDEIRFHAFCQFVFDRQWLRLRGHCRAKDVGLIGGTPIFVGLDSSDVWVRFRRELRTGRKHLPHQGP